MSIQRAPTPPESRGGALWSVFRGEAFDPQGGAPTDKSDAVRHFVVGSLCRKQREPVAALPPPTSKEVHTSKIRATRHNGRAGKNGVFTTKHNDRNFDVTHAEHIHPAKTQENVYWDWLNGMRTDERRADVPSFEEVERIFYERHYSDYVAGQCARNAQRRHTERNRTVEQIRRDKRTCPEETIFQFGKEGIGATPEQLLDIFTAFKQQFEERYGKHVHMLDWAMHCDETTVHIQERHCFDYVNKYGEVEPKQEKALALMGIPLPQPDKPPGRYNNRKITFDAMNRLMLIEIAKARGLDIEEQVKYGGRNHLEKLDYIIAKQLETIRNQQKQLTAQNQQIQALTAQIAEKDAELDTKLFRLSDVDLLIEQVTDICYEKAVTTVSESVSQTALDKAAAGVDRTIRAAKSPSSRLGVPFIGVVETWLGKAREDVFSALLSMADDVRRRLLSPTMNEIMKCSIAETARPAVVEKLRPKLRDDAYPKKRPDAWAR